MANSPRSVNLYDVLQNWVRNKKPDCLFTGKSLEDFQRWRARFRGHYRKMLGPWPRRVPPRLKSAGFSTKSLLRDVVRPLLPPTITRGKKRGFTPPLPVWLKGPLRDFVCDVLSPTRVRDTGFFDPVAVTRILDEHMSGQKDNNRPIWTLLCFVLWYEHLSHLPVRRAE